jgi:hypothetical protein
MDSEPLPALQDPEKRRQLAALLLYLILSSLEAINAYAASLYNK